MTEDEHLLLVSLKSNTQQLFRKINALENENKLLQKQLKELEEKIDKLEEESSDLSRKNEQLKIATQLTAQNGENEEAKQKIDFLVREIDKCIALLNK